jgi:single-stranded DNA-binding protein
MSEPTIGGNTTIIVGEVHKYPAEIRTTQTTGKRFLSCMVAYRKKAGDKFFTKVWKVLMYGNSIDEIKPRLQPGTMVMVTGEADIDNPKPRVDKPQDVGNAWLKIVGQIAVLEQKPVEQPSEPEQTNNFGADDPPPF